MSSLSQAPTELRDHHPDHHGQCHDRPDVHCDGRHRIERFSPGGSTTSTVTVASSGGYAGSVTLTCSLNSGGPTNPSGDAPSCSITTGSPVTLSATTISGQATATVTTVAASTSDLVYPKFGKGKGWLGAGTGAVLALLFFFGIPARRRSWRSMLSIVVAMVALGAWRAAAEEEEVAAVQQPQRIQAQPREPIRLR